MKDLFMDSHKTLLNIALITLSSGGYRIIQGGSKFWFKIACISVCEKFSHALCHDCAQDAKLRCIATLYRFLLH